MPMREGVKISVVVFWDRRLNICERFTVDAHTYSDTSGSKYT